MYEHGGLVSWPEVAAGDVDNDGIDDAVYAHHKGLHFVTWKGGRFVSKEVDGGPFGALRLAVGDMDKKGGEDVMLIDRTILYYFGCDENGNFGRSMLGKGWLYNKVAVGDPDRDGDNEVVILPVDFDYPMTVGEVVDGELEIEYMVGYDPERRMREEGLPQDRVRKVGVRGFEGEVPALLWYGPKEKACVGGDDGTDIVVSGGARPEGQDDSARFQVLRFNGKGFESLYLSDRLPGKYRAWACAFDDVTNDGKDDVIVGSDRVMVYAAEGRSFKKVWEGEPTRWNGTAGVSSVCVADSDGDGLKEIWASIKADDKPVRERLVVYGNSGNGGIDFAKEWESEYFPGFMCIAAGDFDGK